MQPSPFSGAVNNSRISIYWKLSLIPGRSAVDVVDATMWVMLSLSFFNFLCDFVCFVCCNCFKMHCCKLCSLLLLEYTYIMLTTYMLTIIIMLYYIRQ